MLFVQHSLTWMELPLSQENFTCYFLIHNRTTSQPLLFQDECPNASLHHPLAASCDAALLKLSSENILLQNCYYLLFLQWLQVLQILFNNTWNTCTVPSCFTVQLRHESMLCWGWGCTWWPLQVLSDYLLLFGQSRRKVWQGESLWR